MENQWNDFEPTASTISGVKTEHSGQKSPKTVILSVIHHCQNPVKSTTMHVQGGCDRAWSFCYVCALCQLPPFPLSAAVTVPLQQLSEWSLLAHLQNLPYNPLRINCICREHRATNTSHTQDTPNIYFFITDWNLMCKMQILCNFVWLSFNLCVHVSMQI
jgi:hypothetical protein